MRIIQSTVSHPGLIPEVWACVDFQAEMHLKQIQAELLNVFRGGLIL